MEVLARLFRHAEWLSGVWTLTLPQVAATLVAYDTRNAAGERLLDDNMLNAVLVLLLATSILGPILTERFAPSMLVEKEHVRASAQ